MWTRVELKYAAKNALRANGYWTSFFVCLLLALFVGGSGATWNYNTGSSQTYQSVGGSDAGAYFFGPLVASFAVGIFVVGIAYALFLANPLRVGQARFFMEHRHTRAGAGLLLRPFQTGYLRVVKVMVFKDIKILLWSLLLLIPGIVKSYEYYFVEYIVAENPEMEVDRAFQISRAMTDGQKMDIFVLNLSFFGWVLLGVMAFGVGVLFVEPYIQATLAELYAHARERALMNGMATEEELPGFGEIIEESI